MRGVGRDLIRGGHYGQRSCEPHLKAEHMAAPTNAAKREKSTCQPGAVHTWHKTDLTYGIGEVCSWVQSGLAPSIPRTHRAGPKLGIHNHSTAQKRLTTRLTAVCTENLIRV